MPDRPGSIAVSAPTAAAPHPRWQRNLLWLWLGAWIGVMGLFGMVTRVAFQVVPDPEVTGHLVRALLDPILMASTISGFGLSLLAGILRRGRVAIVLPLVLAAACLINQFGVSPAVAEIRLTDPDLAPELAARFAALHRLSVWLFVGTALGTVALAVAHGLAESRQAREMRPAHASAA
jgi:hypothetical protein